MTFRVLVPYVRVPLLTIPLGLTFTPIVLVRYVLRIPLHPVQSTQLFLKHSIIYCKQTVRPFTLIANRLNREVFGLKDHRIVATIF